jgi:anti-anti-sigma factor
MTEEPHTYAPGAHPAESAGAPNPLTGAARLAVAVTPGPHCHRAQVTGEIDTDVAGQLWGVLERALHDGDGGLDIDMSDVTFCDCQGLNVLLRLRQAALSGGHMLTITDPGPRVRRLLALTGTTSLFTGPVDGVTPISGAVPVHGSITADGAAPTAHDRPHAGGQP